MLQTLTQLYLKLFDPNAVVAVSAALGLAVLFVPRLSKRLFFVLLGYSSAGVVLVILLTYLTFKTGGFGEFYLRSEVGYFNIIVFRALADLGVVALFSAAVVVLVRTLIKRRPYFAPGDEWRMGAAQLVVSSGFLANAVFFRLALLPFIYQEMFLLIVVLTSALVSAVVVSLLRPGKGRTDIVPVVLAVGIAVSLFSTKIAGYLVKFGVR